MFIIDLHAKEEKLLPQPSYGDVSFLLLHTYTPMLAAKHLMPVGGGKDKAYPMYLAFAEWSALRRKKCSFPQDGPLVHITFAVAASHICVVMLLDSRFDRNRLRNE